MHSRILPTDLESRYSTVTRCWHLDQTNTSSTSRRKFRLWSRSDGHLLADCSRVMVRRQRTHDRQTVCLW